MRLLLRLLFFFFILSAAASLVKGLVTALLPPKDKSRQRQVGGKLVKDPVCGMHVPEATAIQADGEYFCSEECSRKFRG